MNQQPKRNISLDALRAWSIFGMLWSGLLPYGVLPAWMYHAQLPPPDHSFNPELAGLTWVDLVFPFFIFCMGVAVPYAFARRLEKGASGKDLVQQVIIRYGMLVLFAWLVGYGKAFPIVAPSLIDSASWFHQFDLYLNVLVFLGLLWVGFGPAGSNAFIRIPMQIGSFFVFVGLLFLGKKVYDIDEIFIMDIIILILANVYLVGTLAWLWLRKSNLRMLLGYVFMVIVGFTLDGLLAESALLATVICYLAPVFQPFMLKYLILFWPAIWMGMEMQTGKSLAVDQMIATSEQSRILLGGLLSLIVLVAITSLIQMRLATGVAIIVLAYYAYIWSLNKQLSKVEWLSIGMMLLGALFDWLELEGGIKKDPVTASYLWLCGGLAVVGLHFFSFCYAILKKSEEDWWLINGRNPLLAYVSVAFMAMPALHLSGLIGGYTWIKGLHPWAGAGISLVLTVLVMWVVSMISKRFGRLRV